MGGEGRWYVSLHLMECWGRLARSFSSVPYRAAVGSTGGNRQGVAAHVFCLLQADMAGQSVNEEDWNAEMGDEVSPVLPPLEQVWGCSCWAAAASLLLFPSSPRALQPGIPSGLWFAVLVMPEALGGTCPCMLKRMFS